jgi:hypothetical protein
MFYTSRGAVAAGGNDFAARSLPTDLHGLKGGPCDVSRRLAKPSITKISREPTRPFDEMVSSRNFGADSHYHACAVFLQ